MRLLKIIGELTLFYYLLAVSVKSVVKEPFRSYWGEVAQVDLTDIHCHQPIAQCECQFQNKIYSHLFWLYITKLSLYVKTYFGKKKVNFKIAFLCSELLAAILWEINEFLSIYESTKWN